MKNMINYDLGDILALVGLAKRRSFGAALLPSIGLVLAGVALGAGAGLALAPSSGPTLRQGVGNRIDQIRAKIRNDVASVEHKARPMTNTAAQHS